jgi:hypothetical protein
MLELARKRLRDDVTRGDSPAVVEGKAARAGPTLDEEQRAALWLYGWHHAGGDDACRRSARGAGELG